MTKRVSTIIKNKLPNIILFIFIDLIVLFLTSWFAVWVRFDFGIIPEPYLTNSYQYLIIDFIILFILFSIFKLYTSVWKYASVTELCDIVIACCLYSLTTYVYKSLFLIALPRSFYLIQLGSLLAFTCFSRLGYRTVRVLYTRLFENRNNNLTNTLLVGAGDAGRMIIDEINNNKDIYNARISCVVDDRKAKIGSFIKGYRIEGSTKDIEELAKKHKIQEIIIAIPSASKERIAEILNECHKTKANVKILPSIYKTMSTKEKGVMDKIRPVSYEDFLGRGQIVVNSEEIKNNLSDKVILVTGGGGSIGSELCRQIANSNPKTLIIFDIYENNAYDIQQELLRNYPELDLHTIIGSVRDYDRLEKLFKEFKIDQVYHAAAHKHVPLMEVSPNEAIKNNCLGTLNCCKLADKYKVSKFILISTDKAVRPTKVGITI